MITCTYCGSTGHTKTENCRNCGAGVSADKKQWLHGDAWGDVAETEGGLVITFPDGESMVIPRLDDTDSCGPR